MCCLIDRTQGIFIPQAIAVERVGGQRVFHLRGVIDRAPRTFGDRILRYFQYIELIEKIAEIGDESFHLLGPLFQHYTSLLVYQTLRNLHHAAHDIEHVLHAVCFLGDLSRLMTGKFFAYLDQERARMNYLRSLARVCHAVSHFFATAVFLSELKICHFGPLERVFKYSPLFSASGYLLWTISLAWQRYQGQANSQFASDLAIHLGGFLFEALPVTKTMAVIAPYSHIVNKVTAVAGIIHAWCVIQRLTPNHEEVQGHFIMPEQAGNENQVEPTPHHDHPHLHFYPIFVT